MKAFQYIMLGFSSLWVKDQQIRDISTLVAGPESEHKSDFKLEFKKITIHLSNLSAWRSSSLCTTYHRLLILGVFWVVEKLNGDQQNMVGHFRTQPLPHKFLNLLCNMKGEKIKIFIESETPYLLSTHNKS